MKAAESCSKPPTHLPAHPLPPRRTSQSQASHLRALGGNLVFVQGESLYIYPHGSTDHPTLITDHFTPNRIIITPDGRALFYNLNETVTTTNGNLVRVDLDTLDEVLVVNVWGTWESEDWSPDDQWVVMRSRSFGLHVLHKSGSPVHLKITHSASETHWLTDNTLLLLEQQPDPNSGFRYSRAARFDPVTGQTIDLDVDLDALRTDAALLDRALADLGFDYAQNSGMDQARIVGPDPWDTASRCHTWQIVSGSAASETVLYEAESLYRLSQLQALPDGSLLFLRWSLAECKPLDNPVVDLVQLWPDGRSDTAAQNVFAGLGGQSLRTNDLSRFAVSPDGAYVAWISGNIETGESALHLTDLATGEDSLLLVADVNASLTTNEFIEEQLISAVYWMAP